MVVSPLMAREHAWQHHNQSGSEVQMIPNCNKKFSFTWLLRMYLIPPSQNNTPMNQILCHKSTHIGYQINVQQYRVLLTATSWDHQNKNIIKKVKKGPEATSLRPDSETSPMLDASYRDSIVIFQLYQLSHPNF